ncbi:hypothetical protein ID866_9381 [Astraeus odoratus]|nr:hypothetical protein ID866_9381 [Astraeus odoratus]
MASVQTKAAPTADQPPPPPHGLEARRPSQPFPSPGSSFLPPPVPGAHEFALRSPPGSRRMSKKDSEDLSIVADSPVGGNSKHNPTATATSSGGDECVAPSSSNSPHTSPPPNGVVSPTRALTFIRSFLPRLIVSMLNIPNSLFRALSFQESTSTSSLPSTPSSPSSNPSHETTCPLLLSSPLPNAHHHPDSSPVLSVPHTPTEFTYTSPNGQPAPVKGTPTLSSLPPLSPSFTPAMQVPQLDRPSSNSSSSPILSPSPKPCNGEDNEQHRLSTQSLTSLVSSRPAPPSPAISRRASGISRSSSTARSRPPSGTSGLPASRPPSGVIMLGTGVSSLSRSPSGRRAVRMSMSSVVESKENVDVPEPEAQEKEVEEEQPVLIRIRDYAFPASDPRFTGDGAHAPRANRPKVLARRLRASVSSSSSTSTTTSGSEDDDDEWEDESMNMNGWGGLFGGTGWGMRSTRTSDGDSVPSQFDLDRNFTDGFHDIYVDEEEMYDDEQVDYLDADEDSFLDRDGGEAVEQDDDDDDLLPGIYRALYAFEPEGTAEMKLEEDQLVRVIGRGGGVGWAVVVKDGLKDNGVHALVPESYLEAVTLDAD